MTAPTAPEGSRSGFERLYLVGVGLKGVDGVLELLAGLTLLLAPDVVHRLLFAIVDEASEEASSTAALVSGAALRADAAVGAGATGAVLFLLIHGVVKVATVYFLLLRIRRAYPYAVAVLAVLLLVQTVEAVRAPRPGTIVLSVLDLAILLLVLREYVLLRREHVAASGAGDRVPSDRRAR